MRNRLDHAAPSQSHLASSESEHPWGRVKGESRAGQEAAESAKNSKAQTMWGSAQRPLLISCSSPSHSSPSAVCLHVSSITLLSWVFICEGWLALHCSHMIWRTCYYCTRVPHIRGKKRLKNTSSCRSPQKTRPCMAWHSEKVTPTDHCQQPCNLDVQRQSPMN